MSLVHDVIKMQLSREGYLPNYPYHLISDEEMCDAFINDGPLSYFHVNYPCLDESLRSAYDELIDAIKYHINKLKRSNESEYLLPDWIYSYMLGTSIGVNSDKLDIHDLLVPLDVDNVDDMFTPEASAACYAVSQQWVRKLPPDKRDHRPPTMFGELHVIKYLRLRDVDVFN